LTKGSTFGESRQKRRTAAGPSSPRGLGRAEESKLDSTPAISNHPNSAEPGSSITIFPSRLAHSMPASCPLDPIRHEQGTKSVRNRFRRISLTIQPKVRFRSKTLKFLKPNPSIKLPLALKLVYRNRHPIHWPCSIMLELCHWNLTLCSMHQSFAGVTEAAAACL
jgi:hypothetical protein